MALFNIFSAERLQMKILIASKNKHKTQELEAIMTGFCVLNSADWEEGNQPLPEVEENGASFQENALLKAGTYAQKTKLAALADDSGLEVFALDGRPGIHSARYGGTGLDDQKRYEKILEEMDGRFDRRARFVTVLVLALPDGRFLSWRGEANGLISRRPLGLGGFGYDPIFYYPPALKTFGEMSAEEKNKVSHRAQAMFKMAADLDRLKRFLNGY